MSRKSRVLKILSPAKIAKKYPTSGLASDIAVEAESCLRIPTRIIALNYQLNGGLPWGKILEEFGEESTGKSLLAADFGYCTIALGGEVIWADAENSFEASWAIKNGLDLSKIHLLTQENSIEVISDWVADTAVSIRSRLVKNEPILFVLDSTAAIETIDNIGASQVDMKAQMGNRAKKIYEFFRMRSTMFNHLGVSCIFINQLRRKIGVSQWEDPDTTPGGAAARFYAHQRLKLSRGKQIKEKIRGVEVKVGQNVFFKTAKDKTGPPRSTTQGRVYFLENKNRPVGFDRYFMLPELLVIKNVLDRKKGNSRYYLDGKMLANGEEAMLKLLAEDDKLRQLLIKKSRINTISRTRAKLAKISENLYSINNYEES
jgi:recombination protein RecA